MNNLGEEMHERDTLTRMRDSEGWKFFVAEHHRRYMHLVESWTDPKVPPAEAESIRQTIMKIKADFSPDALAMEMITKLNQRTAKQLKNQSRANP